MPKKRAFIPFNYNNNNIQFINYCQLRILQFNMLADGLSGLRNDLGAFSRANADDVKWETRKIKLLYEILQYDPDIITLQECDHYYDFFLPQLSIKGYDGLFAPKPASACLEVSENSDGCAIFFKRNKLKVTSSEVLFYLLLLLISSLTASHRP
jgi:nocturnin